MILKLSQNQSVPLFDGTKIASENALPKAHNCHAINV
jgi:hypothetical protein